MADYRYLVYDTLNGSPTAEIPLTDVEYTTGLGATGSISGTVAMNACDPSLISTLATEIGVWRNGSPVMCGPIVSITPDWISQQVQIRCANPWFYITRRSVELAVNYDNVDVATAVWDMVSVAQGKAPNGNARITQADNYPASTGQRFDRESVSNVDTRMVGQIIDDWARRYPGFDYTMEYRTAAQGGYSIRRDLGLYAPFKGVLQDAPLSLENGLIEFAYTEDGADVVTRVTELASGSDSAGNSRTLVVRKNSAEITERAVIPMLEAVNNQTTESVNTLKLFADGDLYLNRWPRRSYTATYRPTAALPFGFCAIGDTVPIDVSVDILDAADNVRWTWGVQTQKRVVGITVNTSNGDETVKLELNDSVIPL